MELPSVVHPKCFKMDGFIFQVVAYTSLTDDQAKKIARQDYANRRARKELKAKDRGKKVFTAVTLFDEDSIGLL